MAEPWTLSDKMIEEHSPELDYDYFEKVDIKEFIRRLKEDINYELNGIEAYAQGIKKEIVKIINKRAGPKLVE